MKYALFLLALFVTSPAFATDAPLTSPAAETPVTNEKGETLEQMEARLTIDLFRNGCINYADDRERWAATQNSLIKGDPAKDTDSAGFVKTLGWPTNDKLKNVWGIGDHYILMYDFENFGCMVSSGTYIPPAAMAQFFKEVKASQSDPSKVTVAAHKTPKGSDMTLLSMAHEQGTVSTYIMADTYKGSTNPGLVTVLYFFRTAKDVKF
jgi:hypothetical protein